MTDSIANEVQGDLRVITGARGTGKSTLAATVLPPSQIKRAYIHDSEKSLNAFRARLQHAGLDFGRYVDLTSIFRDLPGDDDLLARINKGAMPWVDAKQRNALIRYYEWIVSDLTKNLTPGDFDVYVLDTVEKFEAGMAAYVEANRDKTGWKTKAYGKMWTEGMYPLYTYFLDAIFARGVKTVVFTSHLKTPWEGDHPVVGKVVPSGKKLLYFLSTLFVWLVNEPSNSDGAPAGLILKERMGHVGVGDGDTWDLSRRLPHRVPHCTWQDMAAYLSGERPCNLSNPAPGEDLSQAEQDMISELVSDKQMELMILGAQQRLAEMRQASPALLAPSGNFDVLQEQETDDEPLPEETIEQIAVMHDEGLSPFRIHKATGVPLAQVREVIKDVGVEE